MPSVTCRAHTAFKLRTQLCCRSHGVSPVVLRVQVQIQEPILVTPEADKLRPAVEATFKALAGVGVSINLVTFYDDLGPAYTWVTKLPVRLCTLPQSFDLWHIMGGANVLWGCPSAWSRLTLPWALRRTGLRNGRAGGQEQHPWQVRPLGAGIITGSWLAGASHLAEVPGRACQALPWAARQPSWWPSMALPASAGIMTTALLTKLTQVMTQSLSVCL